MSDRLDFSLKTQHITVALQAVKLTWTNKTLHWTVCECSNFSTERDWNTKWAKNKFLFCLPLIWITRHANIAVSPATQRTARPYRRDVTQKSDKQQRLFLCVWRKKVHFHPRQTDDWFNEDFIISSGIWPSQFHLQVSKTQRYSLCDDVTQGGSRDPDIWGAENSNLGLFFLARLLKRSWKKLQIIFPSFSSLINRLLVASN